jgi:hypothetical protein
MFKGYRNLLLEKDPSKNNVNKLNIIKCKKCKKINNIITDEIIKKDYNLQNIHFCYFCNNPFFYK